MPRLPVVIFLVLALLVPDAHSQQEVRFPTAPSERFPEKSEVEAILTMPPNATGMVPAVVLIHTRGGYDAGHLLLYAAPLREAGIATFEVILFRAPDRRRPSDYLPHTFGAFKYLATHPQIDPARIGIMGLSLGGILSTYSASAVLSAEHLGQDRGFAAHVPVYPVCSLHEGVARGTARAKGPIATANAYAKLTGAPIHILAGDRDEWDDPDSCQKFLEALSPDARKFIELTVFPGATHAWDAGRNSHNFASNACKGKGCPVQQIYNPEVTAKGRQLAVEFFMKHLKAPSK